MRLVLLTLCLSAAAQAATLHVAPTGDDTRDGRTPATALRTIQAAANLLQPGDTCLVASGVYRETVTFPRSGESGRPITVRAADGAKVTVSGCDPVEGWTLHDAAKGIWRAPMPWTLGTGRNQVFVGGQVHIEARHPNQPDANLGMYVADLGPLWPTFGEFSLPRETKEQQPGRLVSKHLDGQPDDHWKGALYYGIHYEGWAAQTGVVESSKAGEISLSDRTRTWWFGTAYGGDYSPEEGRGMLVGHMNALDRPGEWHWQDNALYLIPKTAGPPTGVEAKRRQLAFDLSGRQHIQVSGIQVQGASARLADSAYCTFEDCHFAYLTHYLRHYDIGQVEPGRDTIRSGETGIFVGGHDNRFLGCSVRVSAGAGFYLRGYHHTIHNCLVDEVSYTSHYLNAITDAVSDFPNYEHFLYGGHVITYNTLRNAGRHFFNFHGNGTSTQSRDRGPMDYMATLFAHNHLYNGMLQTKDAGFLTGYYSSGGTLCGLNSQVAYNVMHDCYDLAAMRWNVLGIVYLDAGSCDVDLHNNLLWAAPGSLQRGLWYNTMCVDVHERDNTFWPDFTRTSADLTAADFPRGVPFRFGHDFDAPPPLPVWPQLAEQPIAAQAVLRDGLTVDLGEADFGAGWQAAVMDWSSEVKALNADRSLRAAPRHRKVTDPLVMEVATNDGLAEGIRRQWTFMYNVANGAWVRYNQVPLGEGYRRVRIVYGNDQPTARSVEVRLDAVDGPLVATVPLPPTDKARGGRIQVYATATAGLSESAVGTHDLFMVFRSPDDKPVGEFEYFRLEQARGALPLPSGDALLELRLDSATGPKLGEFRPRATNGPQPMVANLEPATGRRRLFGVVRANLAGELGTLTGLRLLRARTPIDWKGVGEAPRTARGKLVLPPATNRPVARPNDLIRAERGPKTGRSIALAQLMTVSPLVDGRVADWSRGELSLPLEQNFDGGPITTPASRASVCCDTQALYIAFRNPVGPGAKLLPSSHQWGVSDGVEVAFQDARAATPGAIHTLYGYPDGHFTSEPHGGATAEQIAKLRQGVTYRAALGDGEWTCEWRIPFAAVGYGPGLWSFNLGVRKTSPEGWVVWRGTGGATWQVAGAGLLAFVDPVLQLGPPAKPAVWLDAAQGVEVTDGKVSLWRDQSGNQRHAAQPDARFAPGLVREGLNRRPVLRFDEKSSTRLELPDLSDQKTDATVLAVISNPVAGSEVNHDPRIFTSSDGKGYDYQVGIALSVPGMATGGPRVVQHVARGAWAQKVRVGCFSPNHQTFFTGDIAEILVYNRTLNPLEIDKARAYLSAKWRLPDQ